MSLQVFPFLSSLLNCKLRRLLTLAGDKGGGGCGKEVTRFSRWLKPSPALAPPQAQSQWLCLAAIKLVKPFTGQSLSVQPNMARRFLLCNPPGAATPITFANLVVGQKISVEGQSANNAWTASRITVGAVLSCLL